MTTDTIYSRTIASPVGPLTAVATDHGLRAVLWPGDERIGFESPPVDRPDHPVLSAVATQLGQYFAGERVSFDVPLDLRGTDFQVAVWRALADIPFGETSTYGDQAERIGRPKAARAVGAANSRNPVSIVLPCHRIVGKDGSLTGFAGGLDTKRFLLEHEQAVAGD
ncbi:MAG: methylated-DNA--[protein]-cysteine S-methyltransferase [Actinomycetota bacterium]